MAGLSTLYTPPPFKPANLSGKTFEPYDFGGGGNAPAASPDATNAPALTLTGNPGPIGAMAQGANQGSLTGMALDSVGVSPTGLFSGNFSGPGALSTAANLGAGFLGGMIPGFGPANMTAGALGALSGLATLFGLQGQQTDSHLSGPITEGIPAALAAAQAPYSGFMSDAPGPLGLRGNSQTLSDTARGVDTSDPGPNGDTSGNTSGGTGPGPGGTSGNSSNGEGGQSGVGGAVGGGPGDAKGGTILNSRGTTQGSRDTVPKRLMPGEEVIRKSEASKPGVRAALKDINRPGVSPLEGGLLRLLRKG